jgi:hypothetical protein
MQTNPLQVDNLIANKSVTTRILNTVCVKIYVLPNVNNI